MNQLTFFMGTTAGWKHLSSKSIHFANILCNHLGKLLVTYATKVGYEAEQMLAESRKAVGQSVRTLPEKEKLLANFTALARDV